jgi:hypothetical protein
MLSPYRTIFEHAAAPRRTLVAIFLAVTRLSAATAVFSRLKAFNRFSAILKTSSLLSARVAAGALAGLASVTVHGRLCARELAGVKA